MKLNKNEVNNDEEWIIHTIKNYSLWPFSQTKFSIDICVYEFDYILTVDA